jgi:hypothetical protein
MKMANELNVMLLDAASYGDALKVKKFLSAGADVNCTDDLGNTPLHEAVAAGNIQVVSELLSRDANCSAKNNAGDTPLHIAAQGTKIKVEGDIQQKLPQLKTKFHDDIAQLLLDKGADRAAQNLRGETPAHIIVPKLFAHPAPIDSTNAKVAISRFLDGGARDIKNRQGLTPVQLFSQHFAKFDKMATAVASTSGVMSGAEKGVIKAQHETLKAVKPHVISAPSTPKTEQSSHQALARHSDGQSVH